MKICHSWSNYVGRIILILPVLAVGAGESLSVTLIVDIFIVATIVISYKTQFLEFDSNSVYGSTGLIFKKRYSSPLNRVDRCEYHGFLVWNKIIIYSGASGFVYKNAVNARRFTDNLNTEIGNIERKENVASAIRDGFRGMKK